MQHVQLDELDRLTGRIIGCAIEVHRRLGPGLLESIYSRCLIIELRHSGIEVVSDLQVPLVYRGTNVGSPFVADMLVEGTVVVEVKAATTLAPIHSAQVITYLRLGDFPVGLLLNFNVPVMKSGVRRVDHPTLYVRRRNATPEDHCASAAAEPPSEAAD